MELHVGYYSEHVFDYSLAVVVISFIVLAIMLVYWIHKRK